MSACLIARSVGSLFFASANRFATSRQMARSGRQQPVASPLHGPRFTRRRPSRSVTLKARLPG